MKKKNKIGQGNGIEVEVEGIDIVLVEDPSDVVDWLETNVTQPQMYWRKAFIAREKVIQKMEDYVAKLREEGLDIGKGNYKYGYRMPLQENEANNRELVIFRR